MIATVTLHLDMIDNVLINAGALVFAVTAVLALIKYVRKFL